MTARYSFIENANNILTVIAGGDDRKGGTGCNPECAEKSRVILRVS